MIAGLPNNTVLLIAIPCGSGDLLFSPNLIFPEHREKISGKGDWKIQTVKQNLTIIPVILIALLCTIILNLPMVMRS
jgi:hypothetical protein